MIPAAQAKTLKGRDADTLSFQAPTAQQVNGAHPLEARIRGWDAAQHDLRLESYRRNFGAAEPIRRTMELEIVNRGVSGVHSNILRNKEMHIDWEDVYPDEVVGDAHSRLSATTHLREL